jgi:hypothetical protein
MWEASSFCRYIAGLEQQQNNATTPYFDPRLGNYENPMDFRSPMVRDEYSHEINLIKSAVSCGLKAFFFS